MTDLNEILQELVKRILTEINTETTEPEQNY